MDCNSLFCCSIAWCKFPDDKEIRTEVFVLDGIGGRMVDGWGKIDEMW